MVAFAFNFLLHVESNTTPNILTAASWVVQGNADLDEYVGRVIFDVQYVNGHAYPFTPPGTALITVVPVALAVAAGADVGTPEFVAAFGKVAGVITAGLSVGFVYLACAAIGRRRSALIAATSYAFGTTVWSISAQQIWMHGPAQLFVAIGLYVLARGQGSPRAGLMMGIATIVRPAEAFVALIGVLAARRRGFALRYIGWGIPALAFLLAYYLISFSGARQSYIGLTWGFPPPGFLGLLISPSRGLFVYSPFLVVAVVGFVTAWRAKPDESSRLVRDVSLATVGIYAMYSFFEIWFDDWAYGPRYMADALPLFAVGLTYALDREVLRALAARVLFAISLAWSFLIHFAGAGWYYFFWNGYHWDVTPDINETSYRVWDWADPQWWFVLRRMALDPGWTIVPVTFGVLLAAVLVWRAYSIVRFDSRVAAEHEEVVQPQLKALVAHEVERA
jgi:hypothetical protein